MTDGRVNGNLNLSRALGDLEYKQASNKAPELQLISCVPDIKKETINFSTDDFFVMGCDGIWELYSN